MNLSRPRVLVATTNPGMASALESVLPDLCRTEGLRLQIGPTGGSDLGPRKGAYDCAEALFDDLAEHAPMELADTLVILDLGGDLLQAFSPTAQSASEGWHRSSHRRPGVAVELLLRFPQVFPVFLSVAVPPVGEGPTIKDTDWRGWHQLIEALARKDDPKGETEDKIQVWKEIGIHFATPLDQGKMLAMALERFGGGLRTWFDPTGLRTRLKNHFLGTVFGDSSNWSTSTRARAVLRLRLTHVAVAVDEEREFATLNAYAAYKFGRRAALVTTYGELQDCELLKVECPGRDGVLLRDLDLRFPDIPDDKPNLREDLKNWNKILTVPGMNLKEVQDKGTMGEWTVRAVSSHPEVVEGNNSWEGTELQFGQRCSKTPEKVSAKFQYLGFRKPIGSIYALRDVLDLNTRKGTRGARSATTESGHSISSSLPAAEDLTGGNHGAPYQNLPMAEFLLLQARRCQEGPVENLIGAFLAAEAIELLLWMSPTTVLEALLLQHKKEVEAEVEFPGVARGIDIEPRRKDISWAVESRNDGEFVNAFFSILCRPLGEGATWDGRYISFVITRFQQFFGRIWLSFKTGWKNWMNGLRGQKKPRAVQDMFLSQFWAELKTVYREGEQFVAAERANTLSLAHGRWSSKIGNRNWLPKFLPQKFHKIIHEIKLSLVAKATNLVDWAFAFFVTNIIITLFYILVINKNPIIIQELWLAQNGPQIDITDCLNLFLSTIQSSISMQPSTIIGTLTSVHDPAALRSIQLVNILHFGSSYLLFGVLIAMLYRKVTRG